MKSFREVLKTIPFAKRIVQWLRGFAPKPLLGMTTLDEQRYFEHYAKDIYSGAGEMVDLGCWLGSTTIPLAKGLRKNVRRGTKGKMIHAYDRFIWEDSMAPYAGERKRKYQHGDSFLDEYQKRTRKYSDLIQINAGDILQTGWGEKPIEFLLVDVAKSWELNEHVIRNFFPRLIPGVSFMVQQDFKHFYTSWIHLAQYKLRDHFALEADIPNSGSAVFRLIKPLDGNYPWLAGLKSASDDEINAAFEYSFSQLGGGFNYRTAAVAAAKVMLFIHLDRLPDARRTLAEFEKMGFPADCELGLCRRWLAEKT